MNLEEENQQLRAQIDQLQKDNELMQERIAWLEDSLDTTSKYLDDMLLRVDKVERQIKYLASMQDQPDAVRPLSEETPPPHY